MVEKMRENNEFAHKRIFTCVQNDPTVEEKENAPLTNKKSLALSYLEDKIRQARPAGRKQNYVPLQHPVHVPSTDLNRISNHVRHFLGFNNYLLLTISSVLNLVMLIRYSW